jgi:pyrimidine-specific ribonucleoside hydrolase
VELADSSARRSWLWPLTGLVVVFAFCVGLGVSNYDIRLQVELAGIAALVAFLGLGVYQFTLGSRAGVVGAPKPRRLNLVAGVVLNLTIFIFVTVGAHAVYVFEWQPYRGASPTLSALTSPRNDGRPIPIWIDADPACGHGPSADVDDCWALAFALRARELDVRGVSTVFGNADITTTTRVATSAVELVVSEAGEQRTPRKVFKGSHGPGGDFDWRSTPGSAALYAALKNSPLVVVAQGPLTNVATVVRNHPEVIPNIRGVIAVAGKRPGMLFHPGKQWWFHFRDFNVSKDYEAVDLSLRSGVPLTLIPFEVARHLPITKDDLDRLAGAGPTARWLARVSKAWMDWWESRMHREGFYPFDILAYGYLLWPEDFRCEVAPGRVGFNLFLEPFGIGRDLEVSEQFSGPLVKYCFDASPVVKDRLVGRLLMR